MVKNTLNYYLGRDSLEVGIFDERLSKISNSQLTRLLDSRHDTTDLKMKINGKYHMVEIAHVDDEVDFMVLTLEEYKGRYEM